MAVEQPKDVPKEFEILLGELEERVDRLRSLYEQYFMGYEKMEPGVQRKDVDRRFIRLRKMQIRNTALRFRFNVVSQKFNTYAMYWTRICRQIEEGTFKRHLAKAAQRFGDGNAKERDKDREQGRPRDDSVDVEIGEYEEIDMDAVLAEAAAAAEVYERAVPEVAIPDTDRRWPEPTGFEHAIVGNPVLAARPRDDQGPPPSVRGQPEALQQRVARHAAVPVGQKPRVVLRRSTPDDQPLALPAEPHDARPRPATPVRPEGAAIRPHVRPIPVPLPVAEPPESRRAPPGSNPGGALGRSPPASPAAGRPVPNIRPMATPASPIAVGVAPTPRPAQQMRPVAPAIRPTPQGTPPYRGPLQTPATPLSPVRPQIELRAPAAPVAPPRAPVPLPSGDRAAPASVRTGAKSPAEPERPAPEARPPVAPKNP